MDEKELKGKFDKAKGRVKEAGGALTGDSEKKAEGKYDQAKGAVEEKFGEARRKLQQDDIDDDDI